MKVIHETNVMVAKNSRGADKFWRGRAFESPDGHCYTDTAWWSIAADGTPTEPQYSTPKRIVGKNKGKANETSDSDQAILEITALAEKQKQKGYWPQGEERPEQLPLPMLAQKWSERSHHIKFPCAVQPKLDGIRMLFDGQKGWSRLGNEFDPRVIEHLKFDTGKRILDGELILPAPHTFEQTTSAVRKFDPELTPKLEYHVYDVVLPNDVFSDRHVIVRGLFEKGWGQVVPGVPSNVRLVRTIECHTEAAIYAAHAIFTADGYEGTMVRNTYTGHYKLKDRSNDLLKFKDFIDEEFPVVGGRQGRAKDAGTVIWLARSLHHSGASLPLPPRDILEAMTDDELKEYGVFSARPRGTHEARMSWYENREMYVGQPLTVRYQNLTESGLPRFGVAIAIRDYE